MTALAILISALSWGCLLLMGAFVLLVLIAVASAVVDSWRGKRGRVVG